MNNAIYFDLLSRWCEGLLSLQIQGTNNERLDGAILCPACQSVHGRCDNAIYPFLYMADRTGDDKWVDAAKKLFDWHTSMLCDDGSVYNGMHNAWNGITVFSAMGLCEALEKHGHLLDELTKQRWKERLRFMGTWLYENIDENFPSNINYIATNTCAMAMLGEYLDIPEYRERARRLAKFTLNHFTENGLLYGEGHPFDAVTAKGCRPVDVGYNVEESVPSLVKYALILKDEEVLGQVKEILLKQLVLFLPDGGWDNSFGTRNNKWTYWGSRTSDGCQGAYALLAKESGVFNTAAWYSTKLLERCTHRIPGRDTELLYGGPEYFEAGESPCAHHSFCHANALAAALDAGIEEATKFEPLPEPEKIKYFSELDTYKVKAGPYRATMTGYDWDVKTGHVSGGVLSLLWHEKRGPILLASVMNYRLVEPTNMQLPLLKKRHRPLVPRGELWRDGRRLTNAFDMQASLSAEEKGQGVLLTAEALLTEEPSVMPATNNRGYKPMEPAAPALFVSLSYEIQPEDVTIKGCFRGSDKEKARFILPVIADGVSLEASCEEPNAEEIFFLTGGFLAREHVLVPDETGAFSVTIRVED